MLHKYFGRCFLCVLLVITAINGSLACTLRCPESKTPDTTISEAPIGRPVPSELGENEVYCTDIDELVRAIGNPIIDTLYIAKGEYQLVNAITIDRALDLYGPEDAIVTIKSAAGARHFVITGSKVELIFGGVLLDGGMPKSSGGMYPENSPTGGIEITYEGVGQYTIIGAIINSCYSTQGGGMYISERHIVNLHFCTVSNNTASFGGGIYNNGTLTARDIIISGNEAHIGGGGIWNSESGIFSLASGEISGNIGNSINVHYDMFGSPYFKGGAGGVYNFGVFNLISGKISNNTTPMSGGGVYNDGAFIMTSGEILGNVARHGGGVANSYGTFTMDNGIISGNEASVRIPSNGEGNGGGVSAGTAFIMNGGEISGNKAATNGGGVYAGNFVMNGGIIANNEAREGGGVCARFDRSSIVMNAGVIRNNRAVGVEAWDGSGGGVYNDGSFIMNGGEITGNESIFSGLFITEGVWYVGGGGLRNIGTFEFKDGIISNNKSINGHGGGINNGGAWSCTSGLITGNEAAIGGGVYNTGNIDLLGGSITHNIANNHVGGVYNNGGRLSITKAKISGNTAPEIVSCLSVMFVIMDAPPAGGANTTHAWVTVCGVGTALSLGDKMPPDPVRKGYTFVGWKISSNNTDSIFTSMTVINGFIIVEAMWVADK